MMIGIGNEQKKLKQMAICCFNIRMSRSRCLQLICYRKGRLPSLSLRLQLFEGNRCYLQIQISLWRINCMVCLLSVARHMTPAVNVECHMNEIEKLAKLECSVAAHET